MRRRRLGQHYLVDGGVVRRIIDAAAIRPGEKVLEIGTGRGILTRELVRLGKSFEGYEVDRANHEETLAAIGGAKAKVHLGDAFKHKPNFDVLVASLPYSRSATFVEWQSGVEYNRAAVLLQEDFVDKILADPGTRDYRAISVIAQISAGVEVLGRVERAAFSPQPRVNSVLVSLKKRTLMPKSEVLAVRRLFSLRRRRVVSALETLGMRGTDDYGIRRVFALTPEEAHRLCSQGSAA